MTSKAKWLENASSETNINIDEVVIDEFGLVFHNPNKLESLWDMEEKELAEASNLASPCSQCFPMLHSFEQTHIQKQIRR